MLAPTYPNSRQPTLIRDNQPYFTNVQKPTAQIRCHMSGLRLDLGEGPPQVGHDAAGHRPSGNAALRTPRHRPASSQHSYFSAADVLARRAVRRPPAVEEDVRHRHVERRQLRSPISTKAVRRQLQRTGPQPVAETPDPSQEGGVADVEDAVVIGTVVQHQVVAQPSEQQRGLRTTETSLSPK